MLLLCEYLSLIDYFIQALILNVYKKFLQVNFLILKILLIILDKQTVLSSFP